MQHFSFFHDLIFFFFYLISLCNPPKCCHVVSHLSSFCCTRDPISTSNRVLPSTRMCYFYGEFGSQAFAGPVMSARCVHDVLLHSFSTFMRAFVSPLVLLHKDVATLRFGGRVCMRAQTRRRWRRDRESEGEQSSGGRLMEQGEEERSRRTTLIEQSRSHGAYQRDLPTHTPWPAGQSERSHPLTRPPSYNCSSMARRGRCEGMR